MSGDDLFNRIQRIEDKLDTILTQIATANTVLLSRGNQIDDHEVRIRKIEDARRITLSGVAQTILIASTVVGLAKALGIV